jgi:predicted transcriptional regulator
MSESVKVHIGTPEDMGRRFVDAWHRAERGEHVDETHITFCDLESLLAALTPKRLHILRYVRHNQVRNVKALADDLRRDYKNVYQDVEVLIKIGLLAKTKEHVIAPFAQVIASLLL